MIKNMLISVLSAQKRLFTFFCWYFVCCQICLSQNQVRKPVLKSGYHLTTQYNLYNRFSHLSTATEARVSSGQVLNVLPGVGFGFWIAKPQKWWLSCHLSLEYSPLALDLEQKIGLGTLNILSLIHI